ncbi:hypothetical protein SAMN05216383_108102 [Prevotella sp. KH2C16]|nr:hypothetical protein SAMN05216383_108102 [Prevotella sp. KH2C16]
MRPTAPPPTIPCQQERQRPTAPHFQAVIRLTKSARLNDKIGEFMGQNRRFCQTGSSFRHGNGHHPEGKGTKKEAMPCGLTSHKGCFMSDVHLPKVSMLNSLTLEIILLVPSKTDTQILTVPFLRRLSALTSTPRTSRKQIAVDFQQYKFSFWLNFKLFSFSRHENKNTGNHIFTRKISFVSKK